MMHIRFLTFFLKNNYIVESIDYIWLYRIKQTYFREKKSVNDR